MHKKRPLIKPMMAVAPNGYILDVLGTYLSNPEHIKTDGKYKIQVYTESLELRKYNVIS